MKRIVLFLLIMSCTLRMFAQAGEKKVVSLPFEFTITGGEKGTIKEDGLMAAVYFIMPIILLLMTLMAISIEFIKTGEK